MKFSCTVAFWILAVAPWCFCGVRVYAKELFHPPTSEDISAEHCPASCGDLFRRLRCDGDCEQGMQQTVEVQERGG